AVRLVGDVTGFDAGAITVLTGERFVDELRNNLASNADERLHATGFLAEPLGCGTGPAVLLAAAHAAAADPEAVCIVVPSDHVVAGDGWAGAARRAVELAAAGAVAWVCPRVPCADDERDWLLTDGAGSVTGFAAGPAPAGDVVRSAGMLAFGASALLEAVAGSGDAGWAIAGACTAVASMPVAEWTGPEARAAFARIAPQTIESLAASIDVPQAAVIAEMSLAEVGSFTALEAAGVRDSNGTARTGRGVDVDSHGCIVYAPERLVATLGLADTVVVDTADATLVCAKDRVRDVREVVGALRAAGAEEVVHPRTSMRPWGSWTTLLRGDGFQMKLIEVKAGGRLSLQSHRRRSEHWVVVAGEALVTRDGETAPVHVNESAFIPAGTVHRLENASGGTLQVIEVQVGDYLGEDDIERYEDDYRRGV
ncbi:MAG: cupin domain-containing protein, partial [Actinobacteria bacterium]